MKPFTIIFTFLFLYACTNSNTPNKAVENHQKITTQEVIDEPIVETIVSDIANDSLMAQTDVNTDEIVTETQNDIKSTTENETKSLTTEKQNITNTKNIATDDVVEVVKNEIKKPNHSTWNDLLKKYVSSTGKVNYKGLKGEKTKIDNYINQLIAFTSQTDWSRNEKLAYWINLYNAITVKLILDNYPLKSIKDLYNGKPWDKKLVTIDSKTYSLNNIENDIIRPKFNDARIHFAVNCAAKSCPKLMNGAFLPEKLNYQLNKQAKGFINGSKNNITASSITISKIFDWYKDDFKHGNIIDFLNQYSNTQINPNASINFNEYDWKLNE